MARIFFCCCNITIICIAIVNDFIATHDSISVCITNVSTFIVNTYHHNCIATVIGFIATHNTIIVCITLSILLWLHVCYMCVTRVLHVSLWYYEKQTVQNSLVAYL